VAPRGVVGRAKGGPFVGSYAAASASSTPVVVGTVSSTATSQTAAVTLTAPVPLNATLFIVAGWNGSSATSFSATDNLATHNTYTQDPHINNTSGKTVSLL